MDYQEIIEELESNKELVWYDDDMWAVGYNDGVNMAISVIKVKASSTPDKQNFQTGGVTTMATVNLSSPWCILYREISAMFAEDKDVKVILDEEKYIISVYVEDPAKAEAISKLLVPERYFGGVCVEVRVVPANGAQAELSDDPEEIFQAAFKDNAALSYTKRIDLPMLSKNLYVVFKNKVVQYFNDDLCDVNGFCSTLYQEIAKDIFGKLDGAYICYCTDTPENLGAPLGEWP